jgi:hypothetical protein
VTAAPSSRRDEWIPHIIVNHLNKEQQMLARYRLHASSDTEAHIPEDLRLAHALRDILLGKLPIDNVAPLRITGRPSFASEIGEVLHGAFKNGLATYLDDVHASIFLLYEQHLKPVDAVTDMQFHPGLM